MHPRKSAARTHDCIRHGTSTLFASPEIATGHAAAACKPCHRRQEFFAFLKQIARAHPEGQLHMVVNHLACRLNPELAQ
jgi:hypothetical protein